MRTLKAPYQRVMSVVMDFLCKYICFRGPFSIKKLLLFPTFPEVRSKLENVFEIQVYILKKSSLRYMTGLQKQGDVGPVQYSLTTGITKEAKHCIHMWGPTRSKTILEDPGTVGFSWATYLVDHYSGGILQLTPGSDPWPLILEPRVLLYCFFPVCSSNSTPGPNG